LVHFETVSGGINLLDISKRLLDGDQRALSQSISLLERNDPDGVSVMKDVYDSIKGIYCVGITGSPGVGKSTITSRLTEIFRANGFSVAVLAVDPTSPFTGGAILGDRIRMNKHYQDPGVFIRSMATRGKLGGLPSIVNGVIRLLDAAGNDVVLVETVGVGQTGVDVSNVVDTVVVTVVPEGGDSIQTFKAGLMEIADIYLVNKADRPGARRMIHAIDNYLGTAIASEGWTIPLLSGKARTGEGMSELYEAINLHYEFMTETGLLDKRRRERRFKEMSGIIEEHFSRLAKQLINSDSRLKNLLSMVEDGKAEPYSSAIELLHDVSYSFDWCGDPFQ